jgi:cysteine-rich repeat protein
VCGDGIVQAGEQCDDGDTVNGNGCTNACTLPVCGDGIVQAGEQCDDGNQSQNDACRNSCVFNVCRDGFHNPGSEQCDDGNSIDDDGCTNACTLPACGDGIVQAGEQCDDGNGVDTDGCTTACRLPACGDGFTQAGEQCDDGNAVDTDACTNACALPRCGDGVLQAGEACDDGNGIAGDGCTVDCRLGEICTDPPDNDGNGLVNCSDPECSCVNIEGICHHACPSKVIRRPALLDILSVRAGVLPTQSFDPTTVSFGVTLSNANGIIYSATLQPGDLHPNGRTWQFLDGTVFDGGGGIRNGLRFVRMSDRADGLWRFSIRAFTNLDAATEAEMTLQVIIGNEAFQKTGTWRQRGDDWLVDFKKLP